MKKIGILLAAVALFSGFMLPSKSISLFNGKDLTGWTVYGTEKWYVDNGELVCESGPDKEYGYLATDKHYKNFDLTLQFLQESNGNSGVFFRSTIEGTKITGWQCEVAPPGHDTGGIYESYGRGWLEKIPDEKEDILKMGEWNTLRLRVVGPTVETWLNGKKMVKLTDEKIGKANGFHCVADSRRWRNQSALEKYRIKRTTIKEKGLLRPLSYFLVSRKENLFQIAGTFHQEFNTVLAEAVFFPFDEFINDAGKGRGFGENLCQAFAADGLIGCKFHQPLLLELFHLSFHRFHLVGDVVNAANSTILRGYPLFNHRMVLAVGNEDFGCHMVFQPITSGNIPGDATFQFFGWQQHQALGSRAIVKLNFETVR